MLEKERKFLYEHRHALIVLGAMIGVSVVSYKLGAKNAWPPDKVNLLYKIEDGVVTQFVLNGVHFTRIASRSV